MKTQLKIGVTGGIGSGKSVVCRIFNVLGIPVFDADAEAKRLMTVDSALADAIRTEFGKEAYHSDGTLNRPYMAAQVFSDDERLRILNALVHPVVIRAGEEWAARQEAPYTIKEAALLFESGSFTLNHYTILVSAPVQLRIERVMKRDGITAEQVAARMERQWPEERKRQQADFVIINDGIQAVIPQVLALDKQFRSGQI